MLPKLVTPPVLEPITLAEAKSHLRLEVSDDDGDVTRAISSARQYAEEICWRGFVTQTWDLVLDAFPEDEDGAELPRGTLASITSVAYVDDAGATQTLATTEYVADTISEPGRLRLAYGKSWPAARGQWDAVKVRYVVGWAVADVPGPIKQALLLLTSHFYEFRTSEVVGTIVSPMKLSAENLLGPYRLVRL